MFFSCSRISAYSLFYNFAISVHLWCVSVSRQCSQQLAVRAFGKTVIKPIVPLQSIIQHVQYPVLWECRVKTRATLKVARASEWANERMSEIKWSAKQNALHSTKMMLISCVCVWFFADFERFAFLLFSFHFISFLFWIFSYYRYNSILFYLLFFSHFPNVWGPFLVGLFRYRSVEYSYILLQRGCLQCRIYHNHKQNYSTSSCYSDCNTLCFDRNVSPTINTINTINSNKSDNSRIPTNQKKILTAHATQHQKLKMGNNNYVTF